MSWSASFSPLAGISFLESQYRLPDRRRTVARFSPLAGISFLESCLCPSAFTDTNS